MQFYRTVDNDEYLRIEEDGEASVTVYKNGDLGIILSIVVPEDDRREGVGTALLEVAEAELAKSGIKKIETDFSDRMEGVREFFESNGYRTYPGAPIKSVDMKTLLSSLTIKRALQSEIEGATFIPLSELFVMQWDQLLELLNRFKIRLSNADMARFSQEASGVVYDESETPEAFILCSENKNGIHVELMAAVAKAKPIYIMAAMQGMLKGIISAGGAKSYESLTMLTANRQIDSLLDKVLKKGLEPVVIGETRYAVKELVNLSGSTEDIEDSIDEDMEDEWHREVKRVPMQSNIGWKMAWYRNAFGNDEDQEKKSEGSHLKKKEKKTGTDSAEINFDKDEDVREGLKYEETRRITADNLDEFIDYLDEDSRLNIKRPFFHGLCALGDDDEPKAVVVYELKNIEDEADTVAELYYFKSEDAELGATLLSELSGELEREEVVSVSFEFTGLNQDEEKLLKDAGFKLKKKESRDIILPLEMLAAAGFAAKKAADYVKSISTLNEKQFKRGVTNCLFHKRKGLLEDIAFIPAGWFDNDISSCVVADGKVVGYLLVHRSGSGKLFADLLFSVGTEYQLDVLNMLRFSIRAAAVKYPADTPVVIRRHNAQISALARQMFPDCKGDEVLYGERS